MGGCALGQVLHGCATTTEAIRRAIRNRTIKDATVKRFFYKTHDELRSHLGDFLTAYNFAKRLKTLKGFTPYELICKLWTTEPERFTLNPLQNCRD